MITELREKAKKNKFFFKDFFQVDEQCGFWKMWENIEMWSFYQPKYEGTI